MIRMIVKSAPGPIMRARTVDISAADFTDDDDEYGFLVDVSKAGDLVVIPSGSSAEMEFAGLDAGGFPNVAGVPILCRTVKASAAIGSVNVGYVKLPS